MGLHQRDVDAGVQWALSELDVAARSAPFHAHRLPVDGAPDLPRLHLDDVTGIPFLEGILGVAYYQLRARVRATTGDWVVATTPPSDSYEAYNIGRLGLGRPTVAGIPPVDPPPALGRALLASEDWLTRIAAAARQAGGIVVHPYMGFEVVWQIASALQDRAGVPVYVEAPPPPVTWLANDKALLTGLVQHVCGAQAVPETVMVVSDAEALAALDDLATRHRRIALKKGRCASAMGNAVWQSDDWRARSEAQRQEAVRAFRRDKASPLDLPDETLLACAWLDASSSPSSQLWIAPNGDIRLDGLYEQLLAGTEQVFVGSVPCELPESEQAQLRSISVATAQALAKLGYVGRCSLDFVVHQGVAKVVECNGRWGGTSTPMHLLDRVFEGKRPAFYRAQDVVVDALKGADFAQLAACFGDKLWDRRTGKGQFLLYNVGCLEPFGKFDVIALGASRAEADHAVEVVMPGLLPGSPSHP